MRIAVYHNLTSGGAKRVVSEQVRRLATQHSVTVVVPSTADCTFSESEPVAPPRVHPFRPQPLARTPFGRINPLLRLLNIRRLDSIGRTTAAELRALEADVLLVHPCQFTQAPAVLRYATVPTVYYCHEVARQAHEPAVVRRRYRRGIVRDAVDAVDPMSRLERAALRAIDRRNARAATVIACNSTQTAGDVLRVYGRRAALCRLAPAARIRTCPTRHRERLVLSVGALAPHKGFEFVIRALATIAAGDRPPLAIVSNYQEPAELRYLTELAKVLHVAVTFRCAVSEIELAEWYARAGCFAYAAVREPFGLVILEAMAAGVPVVAVAEGGMLDSVTPGVTGLLCTRDAQEFGAAVGRVLADGALAADLACRARQAVADQWTWEQHEACLIGLLEQAIEGR